jgi:hypothetical protein
MSDEYDRPHDPYANLGTLGGAEPIESPLIQLLERIAVAVEKSATELEAIKLALKSASASASKPTQKGVKGSPAKS